MCSGVQRSVNLPVVADIHVHDRRALEAADSGAACLRTNPGRPRVDRMTVIKRA